MLSREAVGEWIPLMDYAIRKGISLSTLRRYIKAKKIPYRIENGRYLLQDDGTVTVPQMDADQGQLEMELSKAREEIAELKTLIALYEESIKISQSRLDN